MRSMVTFDDSGQWQFSPNVRLDTTSVSMHVYAGFHPVSPAPIQQCSLWN